jgi:DNA-binding MarR family transcriptional regulator
VLSARIAAQIDELRALRVKTISKRPLQRDISLPQLHLLMSLHEDGPTTVSAVATLFGISLPSASSIVDRMEDRGLVTRGRDEADRRIVTVSISQKGRAAVEEFVGLQREQLDRLLDIMTASELTEFSAGLTALRRGLDRMTAEELATAPAKAPSSPGVISVGD